MVLTLIVIVIVIVTWIVTLSESGLQLLFSPCAFHTIQPRLHHRDQQQLSARRY
jgi:hypothetical protein